MIEYSDLLWSIGGTSVFSVGTALLLGKKLLVVRHEKAVQHEFDAKLASLQSKFEQDIQLRANLFQGVGERHKLLYSEKIRSVNVLWDNLVSLNIGKQVASNFITLDYEQLFEKPDLKRVAAETMKTIFPNSMVASINIDKAVIARPYLSEYAWALFRTYSEIIQAYVIRVELLKLDNDVKLPAPKSTFKLAKIVMPEHEEYIDKFKMNGIYYLLEELENKILDELKDILDGKEDDKKHIEQINLINKALKDLASEK